MSDILLFLALFPALFGGYCLLDFLYARISGRITEAVVTGFSTKKDKGRVLPVVSFKDGTGAERTFEIERIDQLSYLLSPAIEREVINVVILRNGKGRVYGYINLMCCVLTFLPLLVVLGAGGMTFITGQVVYILLFIVAAVGGWGILRMISRLR